MDRTSTALMVVVAGTAIGAQAPINKELARSVGTFQAATISFAIGFALLVGICAVAAGGFSGMKDVGQAPWWALLGGACGVAIVSASIVGVGQLGAGGVTAAVVAGQLTASVVIDQYGLLGVEKQSLTLVKIVGIALLAIGVYLIVRE
jgi:bacterial/archaeal transporter family-2 protein